MTGTRAAVNRERSKTDQEIEDNPPIITWVPNGRGVMVAIDIQDPHADHHPRKTAGVKE